MTSADERPELIRVAEAVSDAVPLEWPAEHPADEDGRVLENLRAIESIARVHREGGAPGQSAVAGPPSDLGTGPALPPPAAGERGTWGALVLLERIGSGGFADVYRAFDPSLDLEVALKLFRAGDPASAAGRYLDEARRLARVRHPNVIVIHGADERDGRVGLWTELLHGRTLAEWLAERGPLSATEAAVIGMELCRALAAVHAAGLVHRDVKAENVMREDGGRLVLLDFGAVDTPTAEPLARVELGTPITMAPEQLRGGPVGPAADLYGLGVLLYRLVTGRYPIEAANLTELWERHRAGTFVPLRDRRPELPREFIRVVERALDASPERRYASAGEMERALAASLYRGGAWPRTLLLCAAAAALIGAIVIIGRRRLPDSAGPAPVTPSPPRAQRPQTLPVTATATLYLDQPTGAIPLESGDRVGPGDALFLRLGSSEPAFVYVLNEDDRGALYSLFPVPGTSPANPLPGGTEQRLPGSLGGKAFDWQVTSPGGSEQVCVIASRAPIAALEAEIARFPRARPGVPVVYGRISSQAADQLRGLGGMTEAIAPAAPHAWRLSDLIRRLQTRPQGPDEPWIWEMRLENPGRSAARR